MTFLSRPTSIKMQLLWTILLFSCNANSDKDNHSKILAISDTANYLTLEKKDSVIKKSAKLFDNHLPFQILSLTDMLNKNTTDTDTSKCNSWTLTRENVLQIIKNSESIDGTTWDLSFLVLTCTKSVIILQSGQHYDAEINAASFFSINNGDTTVLYGNYEKSDRKYFLGAPNTE